MHHFAYQDQALTCERVRLETIAAEIGTPVYVYSTATLERHFDIFKAALGARGGLIAYAMKANPNLAILATLAAKGAGADTVSGGEIVRALKAGVPPERIVFSGVGKSADELDFALRQNVRQINVESVAELDLIEEIAQRLRLRAPIALRVNPGVEAGAHDKISTGRQEDKFGVNLDDAPALYRRASQHPWLAARGLAVHIGSQIADLAPLERAFTQMRALVAALRGGGLLVESLDLGGGLGVPYFDAPDPATPAQYGAMIERVFDKFDIELAFEPGRLIVGNAGVLVSRVIRVQRRARKDILVVDAGMNDLVRPAMYDAFHDIWPVREPDRAAARTRVDVVGPICETGDTFARARALAPLGAGDLIAFLTAGAYGAAMSSTYNSRPLTPEVLVTGERFEVVRSRFGIEAQLALERLPAWLSPK